MPIQENASANSNRTRMTRIRRIRTDRWERAISVDPSDRCSQRSILAGPSQPLWRVQKVRPRSVNANRGQMFAADLSLRPSLALGFEEQASQLSRSFRKLNQRLSWNLTDDLAGIGINDPDNGPSRQVANVEFQMRIGFL